jgi:tRNA A-37 threonylcarbamoyl transferase component Bud32
MFTMRPTTGVEHSGQQCPACDQWLPRGIAACSRCGASISGEGLAPFEPDLSVAVRKALRDRYEVIAEVGRGAHAVVYQAIQVNLERKVALKVLRPHLAGNERFVKRFHHEARSIAQLRHPNIVTIHDEGFAQGIHYMAMEYLEGENLNRLISRRGRLGSAETVHIAAQIARALDYAHARGLIHRDVKSGNIIVTGEWRAVLMDFGIAHPKNMAHEGSIIGTPEFMSPEQATGKTVDSRTDFYGLGAVMYHAQCGRTPYESGDGRTTLRRIAEEQYRPLHEIVAIPDWLEEAIDRCLEKDRERRISRGGELLEIFARHGMEMAGLTALSPEVAPPPDQAPTPGDEGADTLVPEAEGLQVVPTRRSTVLRAAGWALTGGALVGLLGFGYLSMVSGGPGSPAESLPALGPPPAAGLPSSVRLSQPDSVTMPHLLGLPLAAAQETLSRRGLGAGPVLKALADREHAGKVFKQLPPPGTTVERGRKVILHVGLEE